MRQWSWLLIPLLGVLLLIAVALPSEQPSQETGAGMPTPPPPQEQWRQEAALMRSWAKKSGGDFDKLPPDVQAFVNQVSLGHGRQWLRNEAQRQEKEAHKSP